LLSGGQLIEDVLESGCRSQVKIDWLSTFRLHDQMHAFERASRGPFAGTDFDVLDGSRHGLDRWRHGLSGDAGRLAHAFLRRRQHRAQQPQ
jgi:hypothetical protein